MSDIGKRVKFIKSGSTSYQFSSTLENIGVEWDVMLDSGYDKLVIISEPQVLQREKYDNHSIEIIEVKDTESNATCWVLKEDLLLLDE